MDVLIALAVAGSLHQGGDGVPQVQRDRLARRGAGVLGRGVIGGFHGVRFRGVGEIQGRLRQRIERLGQSDQVRDLRGGRCLAMALGSARPMSSEARMHSRRAMKSGSAPPSIRRASQ